MTRLIQLMITVSVSSLFSACSAADPSFACSFERGKWDPNDWTLVKSPRWEPMGEWIQRDTHIENKTPKDAKPAELVSAWAGETYTSMVLKNKCSGDITVRCRLEFADQMAPLIVIAPELGRDKQGRREYREHFEIVIYDKGVNVWHHYHKKGKPSWEKAAYCRFPLKPNVPYQLEAKITTTARGKELTVNIDGHEFGYLDDTLPDTFHVGITGCEGVNRFYDFAIVRLKKD